MDDLNTTTKIVKHILNTEPHTRNSDSFLYLRVLEYIADQQGLMFPAMTVQYFLTNLSDLPFPGFETVRRTRQKLQADYPDLAANTSVKAMRAEKEQEYLNYVRS
jgi:hypothetical protein